jgi:Zn finger protein HypA/HybF involved in hydrogenase expression
MHELSLANTLSEIIAERCSGSLVKEVEIEIGSLSGVAPDAFLFCANLVLTAKFGDQVNVIINNKTAEAVCRCGNHYKLMEIFTPCPVCGECDRDIVGGTDVILRSVELENKS